MLKLPHQLEKPFVVSGRVASKVMLDLTVYLPGPSEQELEFLLDLYEKICPNDRRIKYTIAELQYWPFVARPDLTDSGRVAAAAGARRPYLEPVRQRIRDGRAFEVAFWDDRSIDNSEGSWSFSCRRIHLRSTGLHAFARILLPLDADKAILKETAIAIADNVELYSGHGGLVFVYDPWLKEVALNSIYAQARRFWGVDVEDLNGSLPLMRNAIKSVNWITLLGGQVASRGKLQDAVEHLAAKPGLTIERRQHALVMIAGFEPVAGDQHRPSGSLDPYYAVANALKSLFLTEHPDFPGERFVKNGNTVGWIRRFINPSGWR
jgi:TseV toxin immunity protein TsiV